MAKKKAQRSWTPRVRGRAELNVGHRGFPAGCSGIVKRIYGNTNVHMRLTHRPGCTPMVPNRTILSIPQAKLKATTCR